jgi:hypothetical protein
MNSLYDQSLTYYAPWGNLAIFFEARSCARGLLPLGKVEEGLAMLAQPGPYQVRIEPVDDRAPTCLPIWRIEHESDL